MKQGRISLALASGFASGEGKDKELGQQDMIQSDFTLAHSSLSLVIMNPPFTRPTNHEIADVPIPSFAGFATSEDEQRAMSKCLVRIKKTLSHQAASHGNAGLASNFLDLAHLKCRPEGILALVMPLALVQGNAWRPATRSVCHMVRRHHARNHFG